MRAVEIAAPDGTRLVVRDHGGPGPPLLLLHGLAGHAREWDQAAALLGDAFRVMAVDARGHGGSTRCPQDVSPAAHAADAAAVLSAMRCGPAIVAGHSLGGITAMHLAVARPGAVRLLVIADAGPDPLSEAAITSVVEWLRSWPVPFTDRASARLFFGGPPSRAGAWADGLEQSGDGLRPAFDSDVLERTLHAFAGDHRATWRRITSPALVVRAAHGLLGEATQEWMLAVQPQTAAATLETGHDLHLEDPAALAGLVRAAASGGPVQVAGGREKRNRDGRARRRVPEKH